MEKTAEQESASITELLPKNGLVYSEKANLSEVCMCPSVPRTVKVEKICRDLLEYYYFSAAVNLRVRKSMPQCIFDKLTRDMLGRGVQSVRARPCSLG